MEKAINILNPVAVLRRSSFNLIDCISFIEKGEENIYITDDDGRYAWQVLIGNEFKIKLDVDGKVVLPVSTLPPILFNKGINEKNNHDLLEVCEYNFKHNPKKNELPIVREDGHIVALARKNINPQIALDWSKFSEIKYGWPKGKVYLSTSVSPQLNGLKEVFPGDTEYLSNENLKDILCGSAPGILIYGQDLYPDIPKMSAEELYKEITTGLVFQKNIELLELYEGFYKDFAGVNMPKAERNLEYKSLINDFLKQVEADHPIVLEDAYDMDELMWMCDKLRSSEQYGSDNKLYLHYSIWEEFIVSLKYVDWNCVLSTGKVVFLFEDEKLSEHYVADDDLNKKPKPLAIEEINELVCSIPRGWSGSDFFNMILDNHPSLLTIGWHGLSCVPLIWKMFCEDKDATTAIEHMKNPQSDDESHLLYKNLFHALKYKYEERLPIFWDCLTNYLVPNRKYGVSDWFKALFLAINEAVGRRFIQRISPAIFFDEHGMGQYTLAVKLGVDNRTYTELKNSISNSFKYKRYLGVVRSPFGTVGSKNNDGAAVANGYYGKKRNPLDVIKDYCSANYVYGKYMNESDPQFMVTRQVRFEDLKLYPVETTEKICEYLRIPWSETCLNITTNGDDSGVVDGTAGFDTKPLYNPHSEHLSSLDYYRIELLNYRNFSIWGYKTKYYDGMKFTIDELKNLFDIPFKIETQKLKAFKDWPNAEASKEFHDWLLSRAIDVMENGERLPVDDNEKSLVLVKCLYPNLKKGQRLFEC